jgi:hypothetical protein
VKPEPVPYQPWLCDDCEFLKLCPNERKMGEPLDLSSEEALVAKLEEWVRIRPEFKRLKQRLEMVEGYIKGQVNEKRPKVAVPNLGYEIVRKQYDRKGYEVQPTTVTQVSIKKIKG